MSGYQTKLAVFCMVIALNIQCTLTGILFANITFGTLDIDMYFTLFSAFLHQDCMTASAEINLLCSESYLKDDLMCIKCRGPGSRNEEIQEVRTGLKTLTNYVLQFGNDALVQYLQNKHATRP